MHGFWRMGIASPKLSVADCAANRAAISDIWLEAEADQAAVVLFPELAICGYTCGDLFQQSQLIDASAKELAALVHQSQRMKSFAIVGAPIHAHGRLFNCAVVIGRGKIWGAVPKSHLPNYKEFYEKRWFSSGLLVGRDVVRIGETDIPFGTDVLFRCDREFTFGIEICEDLWAPIPRSTQQCLAGADIIFNPSASNEIVGKSEYRQQLVQNQSSRCLAGYVYVSSGIGESTTDLVFSGDGMISENGIELVRNQRFISDCQYRCADIDVHRLRALRQSESTFADFPWEEFRIVDLGAPQDFLNWRRFVHRQPFIPTKESTRSTRCKEIITIQSVALARRLSHVKSKSVVIGVSGGLDSTLALLVAYTAIKDVPECRIIGITMPGFGTTERTKANATKLCDLLGIDLRSIDIGPACTQHFKDIGHDGKTPDVTFENVQARERTQVLMDIANQYSGIVVGTGDMSEMALGWSTYNGDHMSMYAVNCGVPKTLVRYLVTWFANHAKQNVADVLQDIIDTPVSPELLPIVGDGAGQHTESTLGPYEVHDFFLFEMLRYGSGPDRMLFLAEQAFGGTYEAGDLQRWLRIFITRFFNNQFKRSCTPDGPKVGTISLSPRGDWRMPSDASFKSWID